MKNGAQKSKAMSFEQEYGTLLRKYLSEGREDTLGQAYSLGQQAIAEQKSLVELVSVHHQVLQELCAEAKDKEVLERYLQASLAFLVECLSPYEMAHRGFQDSVIALRQLNETLEVEIKRIAFSVHDEAGQLLVAVHLALADLSQDLPQTQMEKIKKIDELLNHVEKQLRRYSHELRPTILDDLGWLPAIRFLAEGISKRAFLDIHIDATASARLPKAAEITLYRCVQEALTNAVKHANARNVWIRSWLEGHTLHCSIRDDGDGFDAATLNRVSNRKGLGLVAMRERVSAIGGTLRIVSEAGKGTELSIRLPLEDSYAN